MDGSDEQLDSWGSRIELDSIPKWIQMNTLVLLGELSLNWAGPCESDLSLNPIFMNPKWIWIHYFQVRIQESAQCLNYNPFPN